MFWHLQRGLESVGGGVGYGAFFRGGGGGWFSIYELGGAGLMKKCSRLFYFIDRNKWELT